jgi:hypothetical protein
MDPEHHWHMSKLTHQRNRMNCQGKDEKEDISTCKKIKVD